MIRNYLHLTQDYPSTIHSIGSDGKLTLGTTMDLLQDIAGMHAAELGVGMPQLNQLGVTWILSRLVLEFHHRPDSSDKIRLTTWPSGITGKLFASRQFYMESKENEMCLLTGSSYWLMLKTNTLRPVSPSEITDCEAWTQGRNDIPQFFTDISKVDNNPCSSPLNFFIGQSKIDSNRHVNNTNYANFVLDWLTYELQKETQIQKIQINFNSALKLLEQVVCTGTIIGNQFRVVGHNQETGKNVFSSVGTFQIQS